VVIFTPLLLFPLEKAPGTHWVGLLDPRADLDDMEEGKFLTPPGMELRPLCRQAHSQSYRLRYRNSYIYCIYYCNYYSYTTAELFKDKNRNKRLILMFKLFLLNHTFRHSECSRRLQETRVVIAAAEVTRHEACSYPCHNLGGHLPAYHCSGPKSFPG
jgi:hypothetical protein